MSDWFLGEIRLFSFGFQPQNWAACNGQLLPIAQYPALFQLIGTTYGGDGQTTFALPNLQGRLPVQAGGNMVQGQTGGELTHTLTVAEMPTHTHQLSVSGNVAVTGTEPGPSVALARSSGGSLYSGTIALVNMSESAISVSGASEPHENRMPYLVLNFCIALSGQFPNVTG
jgi:microcystin-dependent protein